MSWSTSELRVRLAPWNMWNRFKPSSKIFLLTVLLWFICVLCFLCFSCFRVCSLLPCCHLLGKAWPLDSCCWCLLYFCYFPMWYSGSGVVHDCILSWSLPCFLLLRFQKDHLLSHAYEICVKRDIYHRKVEKKAKIRNRYNQVPYLNLNAIWESDTNTRKHNTQESQYVNPFPVGDHKTARIRQDNITKIKMKHKIQTGFTKEAPP